MCVLILLHMSATSLPAPCALRPSSHLSSQHHTHTHRRHGRTCTIIVHQISDISRACGHVIHFLSSMYIFSLLALRAFLAPSLANLRLQ
jgi:hypothetical protein